MREIYRRKIYPEFSLIILKDKEDIDAPEWDTSSVNMTILGPASECLIIGSRGVAVSSAYNEYIDVRIYVGLDNPGGIFAGRGAIEIGNAGILINDHTLSWPAGKTGISVYVNTYSPGVTQVRVVLEYLQNNR